MATLTPAHLDVSNPGKPPGPPAPIPPAPRLGPPRRLLVVALVVVLFAVVALFVVRALRPPPPLTQLPVSGRLEGYESDLGAKVGGRVVLVAVREGAAVRAGQVLVRLDDVQARAQSAAAAAAVVAADDRARQSEATLAVLASRINETVLGGEQATADASGRVAQARANASAAQAQATQAAAGVRQAQASLSFASIDRARYNTLSKTGDVSQQRAEEADTTDRTAVAALQQQRAAFAAAQRNVTAAGGALDLAQSTSFNAPIHAAQVVTLKRQQHQAQAQIAAARADANQARALLRQSDAALGDLIVRAASDGTVIARAVEPGEVVAPGRTLLSVVDLDHVYLRGYISDGEIGRVRVGQAARVTLDSDQSHPLDARVGEIDAQASFTPENVYFEQDRVQEVFGVKLDLLAPRGYAKPGMPADAHIDLTPQ